ncbi:hypothetical protein LIER_23135 [Lithospermum erythrorhizon]|uniref:Uncharacterized protein n=1 Tax=Lithospermum erythrorhizon TaxID=34254 RepID=A0AAV3QXL2_LITER
MERNSFVTLPSTYYDLDYIPTPILQASRGSSGTSRAAAPGRVEAVFSTGTMVSANDVGHTLVFPSQRVTLGTIPCDLSPSPIRQLVECICQTGGVLITYSSTFYSIAGICN